MNPSEIQPFSRCPRCNARPFYAARRRQTVSFWRRLAGRACCPVFCSQCGQLVGYERAKSTPEICESKVKSSH